MGWYVCIGSRITTKSLIFESFSSSSCYFALEPVVNVYVFGKPVFVWIDVYYSQVKRFDFTQLMLRLSGGSVTLSYSSQVYSQTVWNQIHCFEILFFFVLRSFFTVVERCCWTLQRFCYRCKSCILTFITGFSCSLRRWKVEKNETINLSIESTFHRQRDTQRSVEEQWHRRKKNRHNIYSVWYPKLIKCAFSIVLNPFSIFILLMCERICERNKKKNTFWWKSAVRQIAKCDRMLIEKERTSENLNDEETTKRCFELFWFI